MLVHCLAEQCSSLVCFRLCFIDYHGRRSGQFHHLQKMSRSNHWHGDQTEKVKTTKFKAEMKVFILIIFVEIFFYTLYTLLQWLQLDIAMEKSTCTT